MFSIPIELVLKMNWSNSFSCDAFIDITKEFRRIVFIYNRTMLVHVDESLYLIYKISLDKVIEKSLIEPKFICNLNPIKPHLFKNHISYLAENQLVWIVFIKIIIFRYKHLIVIIRYAKRIINYQIN